MRPGELDALKWDDLDFTPGAEAIRIERQWNVKARKITPPKHGSRGTIAMVEPVRERLLTLPRESEWVFTTLRGTHYTPSARNHHWNRVRCSIGLGTTSLYEATRHYFAWYLLNVLEMPDHVVARSCATTTAGRSCASCTGTPTRRSRASASAAAFREQASVVALPVRHETRHDRREPGEQTKPVLLPPLCAA